MMKLLPTFVCLGILAVCATHSFAEEPTKRTVKAGDFVIQSTKIGTNGKFQYTIWEVSEPFDLSPIQLLVTEKSDSFWGKEYLKHVKSLAAVEKSSLVAELAHSESKYVDGDVKGIWGPVVVISGAWRVAGEKKSFAPDDRGCVTYVLNDGLKFKSSRGESWVRYN